MKSRPILFQGAMVRALLAGTKTQTRRVAKEFNDLEVDAILKRFPNQKGCPYGEPGDRLWVRESFADMCGTGIEHRDESGKMQRYAYMADTQSGSYGDAMRIEYGIKWKPSIHMPRAASRIELEIVSVRVERLNECSEVDAISEGVLSVRDKAWDRLHFPVWRYQFDEAVSAGVKPPIGPSPAQAYEALWNSINGAGSWDINPWVWVVEFRGLP